MWSNDEFQFQEVTIYLLYLVWVKLCPGRSCIGISRYFSEERLFKKVHLVKTVAFYKCSVAIQALKINSIQLSFPSSPFAYHRQSNLVLPVSYWSALGWDLGTCVLYMLYCCNMKSLQGWNCLCYFAIGNRGQIAALSRLYAVCFFLSFFIPLILFVPAFTPFPSSSTVLLGSSIRRCLRAGW